MKQAKAEAEGMGDPNAVFDMPLCRFVAVYLEHTPKGEGFEDLFEARNRIRAAKGKPLLKRKGE